MTKPRVYVETTVPSFYHEVRTAPDIVVRAGAGDTLGIAWR